MNLVKTSYPESDVTILLQDVRGKVPVLDTAEREKLNQQGVHYSEMLPLEYAPTDRYMKIYQESLATLSFETANAIASLSEKIFKKKGENLVLVSLARAGTPIGILIKDTYSNIVKISFADALKEEVEHIINLVKSNYSLENIAKEMLNLVGLSDKINNYPNELSGGQKQRVAIARAIANEPKVLLCDEATSALDPDTTKQILKLIREINRNLGITVVVITHEMKVIESICDRVAIIDHSKIAEIGTVTDIFSDPKSPIGKKLILGDSVKEVVATKGRKLRLVFDGRSSYEPVLSNIILATGLPVNILYASTSDIGGIAKGQMIIQLPDDETDASRILHYISSIKMKYEEVYEHEFVNADA